MTVEEIQSLKEQVFEQSSTHSQPSDAVPPTEPTPTNLAPADAPPSDIPPADVPPVQPNLLKENLGFEDWEVAKAEIAQLRQLKETIPAPLEFANEDSKKAFELVKSGDLKGFKQIIDLQEKLATVETLSPADAIKLHIEQANKHFKKADVEDVFEEKYTIPEKPVQDALEDETEYKDRLAKWQNVADKVTRRIERDSVTAKEDLAKLKTEIKFPEIPQPQNPALESFNAYQENLAKAAEENKKLVDSLSKVSEKDIALQLNFNDEASKMQFNVTYQGNKDGVDKAKSAAANYMDFLSSTYYKEDGSPLVEKLTNDIYFLQNREAIMTEVAKQAVNETKAWFLRTQKNISVGNQRNYNTVQPDEIQRLKEQVFG